MLSLPDKATALSRLPCFTSAHFQLCSWKNGPERILPQWLCLVSGPQKDANWQFSFVPAFLSLPFPLLSPLLLLKALTICVWCMWYACVCVYVCISVYVCAFSVCVLVCVFICTSLVDFLGSDPAEFSVVYCLSESSWEASVLIKTILILDTRKCCLT